MTHFRCTALVHTCFQSLAETAEWFPEPFHEKVTRRLTHLCLIFLHSHEPTGPRAAPVSRGSQSQCQSGVQPLRPTTGRYVFLDFHYHNNSLIYVKYLSSCFRLPAALPPTALPSTAVPAAATGKFKVSITTLATEAKLICYMFCFNHLVLLFFYFILQWGAPQQGYQQQVKIGAGPPRCSFCIAFH